MFFFFFLLELPEFQLDNAKGKRNQQSIGVTSLIIIRFSWNVLRFIWNRTPCLLLIKASTCVVECQNRDKKMLEIRRQSAYFNIQIYLSTGFKGNLFQSGWPESGLLSSLPVQNTGILLLAWIARSNHLGKLVLRYAELCRLKSVTNVRQPD